MQATRIDQCFETLAQAGRPALIAYVMSGDPDYETSLDILKALPDAGADIIELGMVFSDPMADGPAIQLAAQRALAGGQNLDKTLQMVREFRKENQHTPIILMGYYNPIYIYGNERFLADAKSAGVDGLIIVDVPSEADDELCIPAMEHGINFIRLATPTTDDQRLAKILENTSGFVYYVSITGITGAASPEPDQVAAAVKRIHQQTDLPVAVGFGVKNREHAKAIGTAANGVVVGSVIVGAVADSLDEAGKATQDTLSNVTKLVRELSAGVYEASAG